MSLHSLENLFCRCCAAFRLTVPILDMSFVLSIANAQNEVGLIAFTSPQLPQVIRLSMTFLPATMLPSLKVKLEHMNIGITSTHFYFGEAAIVFAGENMPCVDITQNVVRTEGDSFDAGDE